MKKNKKRKKERNGNPINPNIQKTYQIQICKNNQQQLSQNVQRKKLKKRMLKLRNKRSSIGCQQGDIK